MCVLEMKFVDNKGTLCIYRQNPHFVMILLFWQELNNYFMFISTSG